MALRMLAAVAIVGGSVAATGLADHSAAYAANDSCANGVTVVVDFTDLGGKLEAACADGDQATGRAALLAAGFTAADSQPGFLCAINSLPNPCPATFNGSFWSYWHSTTDGTWTSYQVGADSSVPVKGELEGWRYNDGTTPPGVAPADARGLISTPTPTAEATAPGSDESVTTSEDPLLVEQSNQDTVLTIVAVGFLVLVVVLAIFFFLRLRRRGPGAKSDSGTGTTTGH